MQFPEQMEAEGGRKIYLNALNNIGSSLIGKINVDRELARAMAHEEMDPTDFANRIRSLPRGEWIASLPSPTFGETGPYPFSLEPLPIPPGHPESEYPLTAREEEQFTETLSSMHEHISDRHGVPAAPDVSTTGPPADVHDVFDIASDDLDGAIAKVVRSLQLRKECREENGWVAVEAVDDELRRLFDDVDADPPSYDALADIRNRSRYLDTTVDIDADELRIRLTEAGEEIAMPDTGGVQAAGGSAHDEALLQIEQEPPHAASRSRSSHRMAARNLTQGRATPTLTTDSPSKSKRRPQRIPQRYSRTSGKPKRQGISRCLSFDQETTKLSGLSGSTAFSRHPFAPSRMVRRGSTRPTRASRSTAERPKKVG